MRATSDRGSIVRMDPREQERKKNGAEHQGEKNFGTLHVERGEQGKPLINHCFHFYLNKSLLNIGTGIS